MTLPERSTTLIRGEWVLTMGDLGAIRDGAVLVVDGEIAEVGAYGDVRGRHPDAAVVGDGAGIVTPGLVNTHTHLSEALVPGMGAEMTLFEWGRDIVTPVSEQITAEMAREGTVLKAVEMLSSGVTTVSDMFVHSNPGSAASLGVVDGLDRTGMRGVVSFGAEDALEGVTAMEPMSVGEIVEEHEALFAAAEARDLLSFRFGIGTLLGQSDELLETGVDLCRANGWAVHTHLAEVREEVVFASLRWGERTVEHAATIGLLDASVLGAHAIWLTEDDVSLLKETGTTVAHNPVANMILGSGVCPVGRLRAAGVAVGVGTDGAASNDSQNMMEAVKAAALLQKVHALDPAVIDAESVLTMATIEGARALGMEDEVGSLEVGKRADVVLFDATFELAAIHDPFGQLVYCAGPQSVRDVWVEGRRLVDDGVNVVIDVPDQVDRCRSLARKLTSAAELSGKHSRL